VSVLGLAQGATYYVSTVGNDSNPGTQSAPFRHVSYGALAAQAGDTVVVMDGTYDNEGQVADSGGGGSVVSVTNAGSPGAPITIMAQNRGGAILDASSTSQSSLGCYGAWSYFDLSDASYVVIQGFVIENACVNAFHINGSAHDITLRWNEIRNIGNWDNPASTLSPSGTYLNSSEYNITFDGNVFHDIGGGSNVNQQHGIYSASSNLTIVNNVFYSQVHGWDIQLAGGRHVAIANNTFAFPNPSRSGQIILWDDGSANSLSDISIDNNIFYQPIAYAVVAELDGGGSIGGCNMQNNLTTTGTLFDNGSTFGGGGVSCSQSNNATSADPRFVNPAGPYDFHLQSGSPAIDSGMTVSFTNIDHDDVSRPFNNIYDRGAYEYHGGSSSTAGATGSPSSGSGGGSVPVVVAPILALSANPAWTTVTAGGAVSIVINAVVPPGANAAFAASGLPQGVTASFVPASCSASCATTMTLTVDGSAPQSFATVVVSAGSASATVVLTVNAAGLSDPCQEYPYLPGCSGGLIAWATPRRYFGQSRTRSYSANPDISL